MNKWIITYSFINKQRNSRQPMWRMGIKKQDLIVDPDSLIHTSVILFAKLVPRSSLCNSFPVQVLTWGKSKWGRRTDYTFGPCLPPPHAYDAHRLQQRGMQQGYKAFDLQAEGPRFNARYFQVELRMTPVWEPLPVSVATADLDGPVVQFSIRQLHMFNSN